MKKNIYLLSYIPFISVLMFGMAFSLYVYEYIRAQMMQLGLYEGLSAYITPEYLNIAVFVSILILMMMLLSFLKLFAEMLLKLSFMFFVKDDQGSYFIHSQTASLFYLAGGIASIFASSYILLVVAIFLFSTLCYFVYILYKMGDSVSILGVAGIILFQIFSWLIILCVGYISVVRLLNYGLKQFLSIV